MPRTWTLPDLIEAIYDAALEPALWNEKSLSASGISSGGRPAG
jgi:hypothetical protein